MWKFSCTVIALVIIQVCFPRDLYSQEKENPQSIYYVYETNDFEITGEGNAESWGNAKWLNLVQRRPAGKESMVTKVKMQYSKTGLYFLFYCEDKFLTATMDKDFMDLWKEDVVEVFLWPDEDTPAYFEYELSPLNYELAILVSNIDGELHRWQPFHYDSDRQTLRATVVTGGEKKNKASISGWTAEFFIPYKLLRPLKNISPEKNTRWRANFYRVDYDNEVASWSWQLTERSFHDFKKFGTLIFK